MAKLKNEAIKDSDLLDYLNSQSDFGFELSVLKMLREHSIECEHGGHYEDPVTKKSREFDIRAITTINRRRVRMAIECKNIRENFPILISCVPRHALEGFHQFAFVHTPEDDDRLIGVNIFKSRAKIFSIKNGSELYKVGDPVGKSTVQVGRATDGSISANDSELYEKWGQCLSSATDLVGQMYWDGNDDGQAYLSITIPFVVVPNGRLWRAVYDDDGGLVSGPEPSDRVSCFIGKDYEMGTNMAGKTLRVSHVEIVTYNGLRKFVQDRLLNDAGMQGIFPTTKAQEQKD